METSADTKTYAIFSTVANRKIISDLEAKGAKVFQIAPVMTEKIENEENNAFLRNNLAKIDWIIFPDIFAVEYFLELLEENGIDLFELDEKRTLAYGEAVADRLRFAQIHADIIPDTLEVETVFSAVLDYTGEENLSNMFFLIPKAFSFETDIKYQLSETGAKVAELSIYRTKMCDKKEISKLKTFLRGGTIDEFIFSSPEDLFSLHQLLSGENLPEILTEAAVLGTNEITLQSLSEKGLRPKYFANK